MFDKNTLIAVVLIIIVMNVFIFKPQNKTQEKGINNELVVSKSDIENENINDNLKNIGETKETKIIKKINSEKSFPERKIEVENGKYKIIINTKGGCIEKAEITDYKNWKKDGNVVLFRDGCSGLIEIYDEKEELDLTNAIFKAELNSDNLTVNGSDSLLLTLKLGEEGEEKEIIRKYYFRENDRCIDGVIEIKGSNGNGKREKVRYIWNAEILPTEQSLKDENYYMSAMVCNDYMVNKKSLRKFNKEKEWEIESKVYWIGLKTKYFLAAFIPDKSQRDINRAIKFRNESNDNKKQKITFFTDFNINERLKYTIYLGPLAEEELASVGSNLEKARQLGWNWLNPISNALLFIMKQLHKIVPNYGFVIIILSILVKIAFWPLMKKQYESMAAMKKIQPLIDELKKKYKNDPQKLQKEQMELFKKHKVNPFGGCLPMLIQFPVMIALYQVFRGTIELRGEGFIFYLTDLASKDPYYILPVIMGITMFIQQKMTIQDKKQASMVYIMPIMMTFLFMNFPAGLVLYWTTVNILSIFQQAMINKRSESS